MSNQKSQFQSTHMPIYIIGLVIMAAALWFGFDDWTNTSEETSTHAEDLIALYLTLTIFHIGMTFMGTWELRHEQKKNQSIGDIIAIIVSAIVSVSLIIYGITYTTIHEGSIIGLLFDGGIILTANGIVGFIFFLLAAIAFILFGCKFDSPETNPPGINAIAAATVTAPFTVVSLSLFAV